MDLTVNDVAKLLQVSEEVVETWVSEGKIPAYRLNNQHRFSREEIENWVMRSKNHEELANLKEPNTGTQQFSLYRALHKGVVLYDIEGETKEEVIRRSVEIIASPLDLDANILTDLLLDREKLMPTAINKGIAVPHTRDFLLTENHDIVTIVFPKKAIEYGALDGEDVHSMFFLFASQDKKHLNLLSKIAYLCTQQEFLDLLKERPDKQTILTSVRTWEAHLNQLQTV